MNRASRQKINKETAGLNNTIDVLFLTDIYRIFYPGAAENTYFLSVYGTFSRIDYILGHKTSPNKF